MKKYLMLLLILILSLGLVACSGSALEHYRLAMEKTDNMSKASESLEIKVEAEYNTQGLDEDLLKIIESFQNITFTLKGGFDNELNKSKNSGYLNFGDFGYDFNVYGVEDKTYMEPFFLNLKDHRYIEISMENFEKPEDDLPMGMLEKISDKWDKIINEENVIKGEKVLVTTDDGEVKSSEFTINLNDEQLKEFLLYVIELFEENEEYLNIMGKTTYIKEEVELSEKEKEEIYKEAFEALKEFLRNSENLNLFYKAYIDVDNYVVQEDVRFSMDNNNDDAKSGELISLEFTMTNKYWNIEKDQELDFDLPSPESFIKLGDLDLEELIPQRGVK